MGGEPAGYAQQTWKVSYTTWLPHRAAEATQTALLSHLYCKRVGNKEVRVLIMAARGMRSGRTHPLVARFKLDVEAHRVRARRDIGVVAERVEHVLGPRSDAGRLDVYARAVVRLEDVPRVEEGVGGLGVDDLPVASSGNDRPSDGRTFELTALELQQWWGTWGMVSAPT